VVPSIIIPRYSVRVCETDNVTSFQRQHLLLSDELAENALSSLIVGTIVGHVTVVFVD